MLSPLIPAGAFLKPQTRIVIRWLDGREYPVGLWRRYALVFFAATLSCTVTLKFGAIQYLEYIFAADLALLCVLLLWDRPRVAVFRPFLQIAETYTIFLVAAFILSLFALEQTFTAHADDGLFKAPIVVTLSRMFELFIDAFYMLYLAALYRDDPRLCLFGIRTYYWTGIAGCLYSFATLPLNLYGGAQLGTYTISHRFRGFNNEGGGFGLYLLSVMLLAAYMRHRGWLTRLHFSLGMAALLVGFAGSQSKSALVGVAMFAIIALIWFLRGWQRYVMLASLVAVSTILALFFNITAQFNQYRVGAEAYQAVSNLRPQDGNFVMGRVAGAVLAPRMIAARPWLGVGWGNYPLVRDDINYRQGTAFSIASLDAPSLGIIDYIVELGFPLWLYLTWAELKPVFMLRHRHSDPWLIFLTLLLPISTWAGAHLNLMHPWVVVAFPLGLAYRSPDRVPVHGAPDAASPMGLA